MWPAQSDAEPQRWKFRSLHRIDLMRTARLTAARLVALDVATLLRAFLCTGGGDPALAFARVLTLATALCRLAGALALTAISSNALHIGLTARTAAILCKHRLRGEHQANHRREHGSAGLYLIHLYSPLIVRKLDYHPT
jgi:hypothetical protein